MKLKELLRVDEYQKVLWIFNDFHIIVKQDAGRHKRNHTTASNKNRKIRYLKQGIFSKGLFLQY